MRLFAEEQRDGTLELLFTHPIRVLSVVVAKFLSAVVFVGVGVLLTVGIPLAISTAGDIDSGAAVAQYIGTFLLVGALVSIGMFTSSLTRNQIVAFILSFTVFVVLLLIGLEFVTLALPREIAILFQNLSPTTHFSDLTRGVLNLRDVLYFLMLMSLFISATFLIVRGKSVSHRSPLYRNLQAGVAGLVVISILVGWFGGRLGVRWDLTEQGLFTLSDASKAVLDDLDDIVTIKLFSSKEPGVRAAPITRDLNDFMEDVAGGSDGKVRVLRRYPDVDEDAQVEAQQSHVQPVEVTDQSEGELNVKTEYLGFAMRYANRQFSVPVVASLSGLEYTVMSRIYRMALKEPKTIGFFLNHDEEAPGPQLNTLRIQLLQDHRTTAVELDEEGRIDLSEIDVLVLPDPTRFIPRTALEQIDEFLAEGGDAIFLLDPIIIPDPEPDDRVPQRVQPGGLRREVRGQGEPRRRLRRPAEPGAGGAEQFRNGAQALPVLSQGEHVGEQDLGRRAIHSDAVGQLARADRDGRSVHRGRDHAASRDEQVRGPGHRVPEPLPGVAAPGRRSGERARHQGDGRGDHGNPLPGRGARL